MLGIGHEVGTYAVRALLGEGGMSRVYRVADTRDGSEWALKELTLRRAEVEERFRSEAAIQLRLDHPGVVRARELVDVDGAPGLVMELVDGPGLDRWLFDNPAAPLRLRDELARQIVEAVGWAHHQGLVHRDLKPGNVLVASGPEGPIARLTDFGLAKQADVQLHQTRSGIALGTPRYMAPEQIRDAKRVDHRADVFSLGALLYELYTGRPAFERGTLVEIFTAVIDGDYDDPAQFGVPERVCHAIRGALEPDLTKRLPDCAALQAALDVPLRTRDGLELLALPAPGSFAPPNPTLAPPEPSDPPAPAQALPEPPRVVRRPEPIRVRSLPRGVLVAWGAALAVAVVLWLGGMGVVAMVWAGDTFKAPEAAEPAPARPAPRQRPRKRR